MCKDVGNLDEIYGWATLRRIQSAKMIKVIGGPDMSIIHVCMVLMNLQYISSCDSLFHHTVPKHDCLALHYVFVFATTQAKFAGDSIRNEG